MHSGVARVASRRLPSTPEVLSLTQKLRHRESLHSPIESAYEQAIRQCYPEFETIPIARAPRFEHPL